MLCSESCRHNHGYPGTCATGHRYRFVEPVVLLLLKEKGRSGNDLLLDRQIYPRSEILANPSGTMHRGPQKPWVTTAPGECSARRGTDG